MHQMSMTSICYYPGHHETEKNKNSYPLADKATISQVSRMVCISLNIIFKQ